jgi:mycothiol synthase
MKNALPPDYIVRSPTMDDLETITQLIITCDIADFGEPDYSTEDLLVEWRRPSFDLTSDARIIVTPQLQIIGYTDVYFEPRGAFISPNTCVHPTYNRQELEQYLVQLCEQRAHKCFFLSTSKARGVPKIWTVSCTDKSNKLFEQRGYTPIKYSWRMEIEIHEPPPTPIWPEGFTLRTFVQNQDERVVHQTIQEAFNDLSGRIYHPFEEWESWSLKRSDFDPSLLFIIMENSEVVATALCFEDSLKGWVRQLAVRRPWRKKSLGLQLLYHAFSEFYRRGKQKVGLSVDSQNATGATHLYNRAGMHIAQKMITYDKKV